MSAPRSDEEASGSIPRRVGRARWMRLAVAILLVIAAYVGWRTYRAVTETRQIKVDYLTLYNDELRTIPPDDRAWPLYREIEMSIPKAEWDSYSRGTTDPNSTSYPSSWQGRITWLERNSDSIAKIREAAKRPRLAFICDDPSNETWWLRHGGNPADLTNHRGGFASVKLTSTSTMLNIARILVGDAKRSAEEQDGETFTDDTQALLRFGKQLHADGGEFDWLLGTLYASKALKLIPSMLTEHPESLTNTQLTMLARELEQVDFHESLSRAMRFARTRFDDDIQRIFTDDGYGDGVICWEGFEEFHGKYFNDFQQGSTSPNPSFIDRVAESYFQGQTLSAVRNRFDRRKPTVELADIAFEAAIETAKLPMYKRATSDALRRWNAAKLATAKETILGRGDLVGNRSARNADGMTAHRDATLIAIAIEQFRRAQNRLPVSLDELVPAYLDAVPLDPFDGKPLRYVIQEGRPILYSVGEDGVDDHGKQSTHGLADFSEKGADAILLPIEEPFREF